MLRGIYTAAAGMISNMVSTDTLANNLANVTTTGFKKNNVNFQSFPEVMMKRMMQGQKMKPMGFMGTGNQVRSTAVLYQQGALRTTGNPLDMAIQGDGFFTVADAKGNQYYTRNGSFRLDAAGYVTTQDGQYLQGENGNIRIPSGAEVELTPQGDILANGTKIDRLKITRFENNHTLAKLGDNLFIQGPESKVLQPGAEGKGPKPALVHKQIEESNVSVVGEMVRSITGMRLYEALQRDIHVQDTTLQKLIDGIGK